MKKIFLIILQLLSLIQLTHAGIENQILEGTYVGNGGNRANISSYRDQGIYNYDLLLTDVTQQPF